MSSDPRLPGLARPILLMYMRHCLGISWAHAATSSRASLRLRTGRFSKTCRRRVARFSLRVRWAFLASSVSLGGVRQLTTRRWRCHPGTDLHKRERVLLRSFQLRRPDDQVRATKACGIHLSWGVLFYDGRQWSSLLEGKCLEAGYAA
jgi:hypothetical protein